jgi:hypothetical protein
MGKNSRARREARRRDHQRTPRVTSRDRGPDHDDVIALIDVAARYAVDAPHAIGPYLDHLNQLGAAASSPHRDPAALVVDEVLSRITSAYEHGWQPLNLVHAARRQTSPSAARWLARAVLVESARTGAMQRAPQEWVGQLHALSPGRARIEGADGLLPSRGAATRDQWVAALVVIDLVHRLPRSEVLVPPPSTWGQQRPASATAPAAPRSDEQARMLTKVRALLAKAESTEFSAEADALTAKAQDLMTRHSIDEALLAAGAGETFDVRGVRVLIDQPYALEKATLLHVVAEANRVRAIWNDFASCVTLVGLPTDVAQVDMLFTSILLQATRAMTHEAGSSAAFRRAFLHAFAVRIGERLAASADEAIDSYGSALVPVLQQQDAAISEEFDRLFPHVTSGSRRRRQLDARGWDAGTRAADSAVLPAGRLEAGGG